MDYNADAIIEKLKELINKGNITKIVVKKGKKVVLSCPVTVGVAGVIIVPWAMILGVVTALGTKCTITCVDETGQELDLDGRAADAYDKAKDAVDKATEGTKMSQIMDLGKEALEKGMDLGKEALEKGKDAWGEFSKEGGKLEQIEEKGKEAFEKGKETFEKVMADEKVNNAINEAKKVAEKAADKAIKFAEDTQIKR